MAGIIEKKLLSFIELRSYNHRTTNISSLIQFKRYSQTPPYNTSVALTLDILKTDLIPAVSKFEYLLTSVPFYLI